MSDGRLPLPLMSDDEARQQRAALRQGTMTLLKTRLGAEPADATVRGAQAVSLVGQLTLMAWAMAGRSLPTYSRAETPVKWVPQSRA